MKMSMTRPRPASEFRLSTMTVSMSFRRRLQRSAGRWLGTRTRSSDATRAASGQHTSWRRTWSGAAIGSRGRSSAHAHWCCSSCTARRPRPRSSARKPARVARGCGSDGPMGGRWQCAAACARRDHHQVKAAPAIGKEAERAVRHQAQRQLSRKEDDAREVRVVETLRRNAADGSEQRISRAGPTESRARSRERCAPQQSCRARESARLP